jgi:SHS2 domain-containing protein
MPFEYLEDGVTSDVTFRASGRDLDELFHAAADATAQVMVGSLESIRTPVARSLRLHAHELDLLLFRFLNEQIFYKDADDLLLRPHTVRVERVSNGYALQAELRGEPIDRRRHELLADVKAVTLHGLCVERVDSAWHAQVTLDV